MKHDYTLGIKKGKITLSPIRRKKKSKTTTKKRKKK